MVNRKLLIKELENRYTLKLENFIKMIDDLRNSNTETKSSMGDKYETSREMLQQEIMQIQKQLANYQMHQTFLKRLKEIPAEKVEFGSIVKTSFGNFIIVSSLGEIDFESQKFIAISEQSPLAQLLLGKLKGDSFTINTKLHEIEEVG